MAQRAGRVLPRFAPGSAKGPCPNHWLNADPAGAPQSRERAATVPNSFMLMIQIERRDGRSISHLGPCLRTRSEGVPVCQQYPRLLWVSAACLLYRNAFEHCIDPYHTVENAELGCRVLIRLRTHSAHSRGRGERKPAAKATCRRGKVSFSVNPGLSCVSEGMSAGMTRSQRTCPRAGI